LIVVWKVLQASDFSSGSSSDNFAFETLTAPFFDNSLLHINQWHGSFRFERD